MSVQDTTNTATRQAAIEIAAAAIRATEAAIPDDWDYLSDSELAGIVVDELIAHGWTSPAMADQIRADERRKVAEQIAARIIERAHTWRNSEAITQHDVQLLMAAAREASEIGGKP